MADRNKGNYDEKLIQCKIIQFKTNNILWKMSQLSGKKKIKL